MINYHHHHERPTLRDCVYSGFIKELYQGMTFEFVAAARNYHTIKGSMMVFIQSYIKELYQRMTFALVAAAGVQNADPERSTHPNKCGAGMHLISFGEMLFLQLFT